ncbi:CapA family protein [Streptomyces pimonensis]|uniref:CapA family protein n=1 Tax=Streptomyces pimonensis TaxID=2860288 RepID=UPI003FA0573E
MPGRGADRVLPHPGDPALREDLLRDARGCVEPARSPRPVPFSWPWGRALEVPAGAAPDVRGVDPETSVTRSDAFAPGKTVRYRVRPAHVPAVTVARPDGCVLAGKHVPGFGRPGLRGTPDVLHGPGLGSRPGRAWCRCGRGGCGRHPPRTTSGPGCGRRPTGSAGADSVLGADGALALASRRPFRPRPPDRADRRSGGLSSVVSGDGPPGAAVTSSEAAGSGPAGRPGSPCR